MLVFCQAMFQPYHGPWVIWETPCLVLSGSPAQAKVKAAMEVAGLMTRFLSYSEREGGRSLDLALWYSGLGGKTAPGFPRPTQVLLGWRSQVSVSFRSDKDRPHEALHMIVL